MDLYKWKGIDQNNRIVNGLITANDLTSAQIELRHRGIITTKISRQSRILLGKKRIRQTDIALFSRQIATMTAAGIPLVQSLELIIAGQNNPSMQYLLNTIKKNLESGLTFAESLHKHKQFFSDLSYNLVSIGEKTGTLDIILKEIAAYHEKILTIKKKLKKALFYPIIVLIFTLFINIGLLVFVVPQFEALFSGFGASLPTATRIVIDASKLVQTYGISILILIIASIYAVHYAYLHNSFFTYCVDRCVLKFPVGGSLLHKAMIARFSRALSITCSAGLPLMDSLKLIRGILRNRLHEQAIDQIREEIAQGLTLQQAIRNTQCFPLMVIQMIAIGEESGTLEYALNQTALLYEEELDSTIETLGHLLEPTIMAILGALVGILIIAMYLPMFKLGSVI